MPETFLAFLAIVLPLAVFAVQLLLAFAVRSAARVHYTKGNRLTFGSYTLWFWYTLVFGFAAAALYWVVHHSTLRASEQA